MTLAEGSKLADAAPRLFETQTYLISVPPPALPGASSGSQPLLFAMQVLCMDQSYSVWIGLATEAIAQQAITRGESKNDADTELDEELEAALTAAGRDAPEATAGHVPFGSLATEWAVSMVGPQGVTSSSLFRSVADLASPMSQRLARKLGIRQLFLSLDIPPDLFAGPGASPLLHLEKAVSDVFRQKILPGT